MQWLGQQPQIYYQLLQTSGPQLQTSGQLFDLWNTSYVQFGFWTIETTCEWSAIESFGWLRAKSLCKTGCGCGRLILLLEPPDPPTETLVLSILHPNVHKSCWIASWLTVRRPIELAIKVPNYVIPVGLPNYFARGPYDLFWQITERVITDELLQTIRAERFLSRADGVRVIQSSCNT